MSTVRKYVSLKPYRLNPSMDASVLSGALAHHDDYFPEDTAGQQELVARVLTNLLDELPEIQRVALDQLVIQGATLRHAVAHYAAGQLMDSPLARVRVAAHLGLTLEQVTFPLLVELGEFGNRKVLKPAAGEGPEALAEYELELAHARELRRLLGLSEHKRMARARDKALATLREQLLAMSWLRPYLSDLLAEQEAGELGPASAGHLLVMLGLGRAA